MPSRKASRKESKKHTTEKDPRRKDPARLRTYSFLATIAIIAVILIASYIASLPTIEHLPSTFEFNKQQWMAYVPSEVQTVVYVNYDRAFAVSGNRQLFGVEAFLQLYQLDYNIFSQDLLFEVDIELPSPHYSGTVTVLKMQSQPLGSLAAAVADATKAPKWQHGEYTVYGFLMRKAGDKASVLGYLSLASGYVVFSNDQTSGRQGVERVLDQFASNSPNLFDNTTVRKAVYAAGITDQAYAGLYIGMFPSQLKQSTMIVKSIVQQGDGILVTRSIMFPSEDVAVSQLQEAHNIYRDASYKILDSWLVVSYHYSTDKLRNELTGI